MARKSPLVIGLDVGTYKIGVIVAEVTEGGVEVVGIGTAASRGLRKGVVVNIEKTVEAIRRAVEEAELMAACEIRSVIAGSAGSHIRDLLAGPLAAAEAVLTPEERELGAALVDVGGGTIDVVVYQAGTIRHTAVLPVGGGHVTSDLAAALCTPPAEAEHLKQRHGSALAALTPAEQTIEVPGLGGRAPHYLSRRAPAQGIEPRAEGMLMLARAEIQRAGCYQALASGGVLTRGGAGLEHMTALAQRVFPLPLRLGGPPHLIGLVDA